MKTIHGHNLDDSKRLDLFKAHRNEDTEVRYTPAPFHPQSKKEWDDFKKRKGENKWDLESEKSISFPSQAGSTAFHFQAGGSDVETALLHWEEAQAGPPRQKPEPLSLIKARARVELPSSRKESEINFQIPLAEDLAIALRRVQENKDTLVNSKWGRFQMVQWWDIPSIFEGCSSPSMFA